MKKIISKRGINIPKGVKKLKYICGTNPKIFSFWHTISWNTSYTTLYEKLTWVSAAYINNKSK